jgi:RND family efflux transporter MFP subunit
MKSLFVLVAIAGVTASAAAAQEVTVEARMVDDRKAVFATVESVHTLMARARIGGTVGDVSVREGDSVRAGQRIAFIGDRKLILQMESLSARVQSARAEREQAQTEFDRAQALFKQGVIPKARLDDAQTRLQVADRGLAAMRAEQEVVAQRSAEGAVLAPGAGRVLKVHVTDGTAVLPGELVVSIAAAGYVLRLHLPERHARFLKVGTAVRVGERGLVGADMAREGKVTLVYPQVEQGQVVADVAVEGLGDYFVGERVPVYVPTGKRRVLVVPANYVYQRYGVSFVRLKDGREAVVQPGLAVDGDAVEILSGLGDDDIITPPPGNAARTGK